MEVAGGSNNKPTVVLYELLGTALFIYGILVSGGDATAVPIALFASILIFGNITGGHFNPAVTLGVWITKGNCAASFSFAMMIIFGQILGGFLAIALAYVSLYSNQEGVNTIETPAYACPTENSGECDNTNGEGFDYDVQSFVTQVICTYIFVSVILMVKGLANPKTAPTSDGMLGPLTVVLTLAGLIQVAMRLGPVFNPAVGITLTTLDTWQTENPNGIYTHYAYAYTLGPAIGGLLAGFTHLNYANSLDENKKGAG